MTSKGITLEGTSSRSLRKKSQRRNLCMRCWNTARGPMIRRISKKSFKFPKKSRTQNSRGKISWEKAWNRSFCRDWNLRKTHPQIQPGSTKPEKLRFTKNSCRIWSGPISSLPLLNRRDIRLEAKWHGIVLMKAVVLTSQPRFCLKIWS